MLSSADYFQIEKKKAESQDFCVSSLLWHVTSLRRDTNLFCASVTDNKIMRFHSLTRCVCVCTACTDADLKSLASRLKDWFGVLHMDANRDLKISASDNGQGRKHITFCTFLVCL